MNLSRRSSASSIYPATSPPLSAPLSSSSLRRLHPLSRSYSSGAILETEREHDDFGSIDDYSYDYDEYEEEEQEDHTLEESGQWAQRHRLGRTSQQASWQRRHQPPPSTRSRNRRNHQTQTTSRTSTGSIGSGFSLEVTIPEGSIGEERSKTPFRLRRPSSHASIKSSIIGAGGGGGRDSTGSSSLDNRSSGFSSNGQRRSGGEDSNHFTGGNGNTPSSVSSTLSIPMPSTPKDIFDPAAPPLLSSTRGMSSVNKEKSLPPLPAGGLKKKSSGNLQKSNGTSSSTTTVTPGSLNGTGKYAFPSTRIRTFSSTSPSTSTPSPTSPISAAAVGSPSILSPSSSAATIKPFVRPLQLPRQTTRIAGDRLAVPVPSPILNSPPLSPAVMNSLRAPTPSLSALPKHRPSLPSPIALSSTTSSAPNSPAVSNAMTTMTTGIVRAKPRTGTGMVYRSSSHGVGSKMRAPMMLSGSSSLVSNGSVSAGGGSGSNGFVGAIAL